ncbi:hypothetical protein LS73_003800 [Helicobacter muridarum]|uniref:DUF5644 domain-containing protein n=1 Tax=Helicobacter muridarum TaxID=216 RepID=A0A377PY72_9HELI|nr:DUF5644 domain-containing protein [Helicobacter muridarum]TLE00783.1 hypothetical protein LS73_003800 [Helicobacter muridarum]STQ86533.1 Uncharacterised protein [Helicobacter muridarum]
MRLCLDVFSFDSRIDFQNGYVRVELHCPPKSTLKNVLEKIPSKLFGYQEFGVDLDFIHCRINGIAVLEDLAVKDLVDKFGVLWVVEPLSKRYVKKDLILDLDLAFQRYQGFFYMANFIYSSEREELKKYLLINFIATSYDDEYYGDGFLLYIKWLMGRHPMQIANLLRFISHKENGVFSHIPVANLIFPENPIIDDEIQSLQSQLINSSRCPIHKGEWVFLGKQLDMDYGFQCINKIQIDENAISRCPIFSGSMGKINMKEILIKHNI